MALFVCEPMIHPTFEEFCRLAEQGNLIPVYQELLMDLETPLSFFKRLERDRYAFLLESVEGSERWARYSFLGSRPRLVFKSRGKQIEIVQDGKRRKLDSEMPLDTLKQLVGNYRPVPVPGVPPFSVAPWVMSPTMRSSNFTGLPTPNTLRSMRRIFSFCSFKLSSLSIT